LAFCQSDRLTGLIESATANRGTLTIVEEGCTGQGSNRTGRVPFTKDLSGDDLAKFVDLSYVSADGWLDAQPR